MKDFEYVKEEVKKRLTEKRFYHSMCTMERAVEYAKIYGENIENARLAGIAHDIAKELTETEKISLVERYKINLDDMENNSMALAHSKIGAVISKYEFEFNEELCNAIAYHTTGRENMTLLEKIIFVSDATGKDRKFDDTEEVYELAKKDLELAIIKILKETIKEILEKNKPMHLDTIKAYNYYIK